jgi:hypothetical protein
MITVEQILEDCERELQIARENGDTRKIELLLECKERFSDGKGFNRKTVSDDTLFLAACFDYPVDKIIKIREYLEDSFKVKGILYVLGSDGREYPEEVWLDPEMEGYYQFLPYGLVCKTVSMGNGYDQTYKLCDGQWVYDGSLQKWFEDPGYDYEPLRYEIPARKENAV